jgi:uncharacterized protein with FMN-binding domain
MCKKALGILISVLVAGLLMIGCFVEFDPTDVGSAADPYGNPPYNGTKEATIQSSYGPVTVTVTLKDGIIDEVKIVAPGVSPIDTGPVVRDTPALIKAANKFDIDALAAASPCKFTKPAIKEAGEAALKKFEE